MQIDPVNEPACLQKIVTEALLAMVSSITGMSPPPNEPPPGFIQAPIDRAVYRINQHFAPIQAEIEGLRALSVTNIMLDVVPGEDGMGEEVFARTVSDVEVALSAPLEKIEKLEDERDGLKVRIDKLETPDAAAPELLNALVFAEEWLVRAESLLDRGEDDSPNFEPAILMARDAIAKSTSQKSAQ